MDIPACRAISKGDRSPVAIASIIWSSPKGGMGILPVRMSVDFECISLPIPALRPGPKKTLSNYKGAKGNVCARTRVTGCCKSLWAGEIIALKFSEIVDFRATIARAIEPIHH